jgi:hypothetical protein
VLVAHTSNPSYSRGRVQEDCGSKPARANSSQDPILKMLNTKKRAGRVAQEVQYLSIKCEALSSKPQYLQKTKLK